MGGAGWCWGSPGEGKQAEERQDVGGRYAEERPGAKSLQIPPHSPLSSASVPKLSQPSPLGSSMQKHEQIAIRAETIHLWPAAGQKITPVLSDTDLATATPHSWPPGLISATRGVSD